MQVRSRAETEIIHRGEGPVETAAPLTLPIYETTTFLFESAEEVRRYNEGRSARYLYSRYENPTVQAVEAKIAALEEAEAALLFGSGMGATATTLLALAKAGDEIVCSASVYGGTFHLIADLLPRLGVRARFASLDELNDPARLFESAPRLVWFESPVNPTLRCVDIAKLAAACRAAGALSIIDNTFATPINQRPLALGVDLVMHSATKYLNGHSDVTAGAVAGSRALVGEIARVRRLLGTILDPAPAYALGRGLKTLALRVARQNASALAVAEWLERDRRVARVYHPGLPSHPDHAIAARQMSGFGGMVCLDLGGGYERAARFFDRLKLFRRAASLGGVESLCSLPILTSHWGCGDEELRRAGVTPSMARLSIGLEAVEDLIADLDQALD
jgi:cystathionine beta-lyase/cystathionine gamma-synthase